jgi:hypothetical protein
MKPAQEIVCIRVADGNPDNPKAFALAQAYMKKTFGKDRALALTGLRRIWAIIVDDGNETPDPVCVGLIGARECLDLPVCHVDDEKDRPRLLKRVADSLMDMGHRDGELLLFVDPGVEQFIEERYLKPMGAVRANRWRLRLQGKVRV